MINITKQQVDDELKTGKSLLEVYSYFNAQMLGVSFTAFIIWYNNQ
jgi:hypothetical protein